MGLLRLIVQLYTYVVFAAVILSWVPDLRKYPIARFIEAVTEPVLAQVRKVIPPIGGPGPVVAYRVVGARCAAKLPALSSCHHGR